VKKLLLIHLDMDRAYGTQWEDGGILSQRIEIRCYNMGRAYGSGQYKNLILITPFGASLSELGPHFECLL
jgi:hypothetical protein